MKRSRRVLVISQVPPPVHGSAIMTQLLLESLRRNGYEALLVDRRYSRHVNEVGKLSARKLLAAPSLMIRFVASVARWRPRVCVLFLTNRPASFVSDFVLCIVARLLKLRVIVYIHTTGYRELASRGAIWQHCICWVFKNAAQTVCLGPSLVEDVEGFSSRRPVFIRNFAVPPPTLSGNRLDKIVYLSNLLPHKGALDFIKLATRLHADFPDFSFELAGNPGPEEFMLRVSADLDSAAGGFVRYVGPLNAEEKWQFLNSAQVLVFPSTYPYEAQPLTIIEALEIGTRVVAYDVGGIRDLTVDEAPLYLSEAGDIAGLETNLRTILAQRANEPNSALLQHAGAARFDREWADVLADSFKDVV